MRVISPCRSAASSNRDSGGTGASMHWRNMPILKAISFTLGPRHERVRRRQSGSGRLFRGSIPTSSLSRPCSPRCPASPAASGCGAVELTKLYAGGAFVPGSIAAVDILGADCEASGLVWETGDADAMLVPVPGGLVPAPWLGLGRRATALFARHARRRRSPFDPRCRARPRARSLRCRRACADGRVRTGILSG